jgi:hypothetical protein
MDSDGICAGLNKSRHVVIRVFNHKMNVERKSCHSADSPDHFRPEGNIIDEMSIHDVAVNPICACGLNPMDFVIKPREIRSKNRGCDEDFWHC